MPKKAPLWVSWLNYGFKPQQVLFYLFSFRNAKEVGKDAVEKDNSTENTNQKVEHIELFIHPWFIGLLGNRKLRQRKYQKGKPEL